MYCGTTQAQKGTTQAQKEAVVVPAYLKRLSTRRISGTNCGNQASIIYSAATSASYVGLGYDANELIVFVATTSLAITRHAPIESIHLRLHRASLRNSIRSAVRRPD